jgi:hypothetical protein
MRVETYKRKFLRGHWPPPGMDEGCRDLCTAINAIPGIVTIESCEGHGQYPYRIYFKAQHLLVLPPLLYWLDSCHTGFGGWQVITYTDCSCASSRFRIEGPVGEEAVKQSKEIARMIWNDLRKNRQDYRDRLKAGFSPRVNVF